MSKNDCQVCLHAERSLIDLALQTPGRRLKDLAEVYGVSKFALSRHRQRHLAVPPAKEEVVDDSEEIQRWLGRAEEIYQISTVNSDVRGMVASLTAALRSLEVKGKAKEREAEAAELRESGDVPPISIQQIDALLEKFDENASSDDKLISEICWHVRYQLLHHGSVEQLGLLARFLEISLPSRVSGLPETLASFRDFAVRRTTNATSSPILIAGVTN